MKKNLIFCFLFSLLTAGWQQPLAAFPRPVRPPGASDLDIIRARIVQELMGPRVDEERVSEFIRTLREDGSWPGIDYTDTSRTGFQHSIHMSRLVSMSRAYQKKGTGFYKNRQLKAAFGAALDYWLERDFICENWWWNQIGVPGEMVRVLLIMGKGQFSPSQWEQALRIAGRASLHASGARPSGDRIVIAGILAKALLAAGDGSQFNQVIKVIEGEIKFSTGRGMQYDYSFHHREDRVNNTLSYGTSYTNAFAEWAEYVAGTSYAFSPASLHQLIDYYLDGICRMLAFDKYPDPGAKNRGITRRGALRAIGPGIPLRLLKASSYRSDELRNIVAVREGKPAVPRPHTTFFWQSEHLTHQRPAYFTSVRMFSSRNHNMEVPYNSEGLLNHYLGNGSNFISRTGTEYYDIFPVFDYHKIPGATLVQHRTFPDPGQIRKAGIRDFVGGVTNGTFGAAVFDFLSVRDSIRARKAWFFFDGKYVCLGAGIGSPARDPVATTLNQSLLKTNVVVMAGGKRTVEQKGEHAPGGISWVWHDSIGYVFPVESDVHISNQAQTGSWYRINQQSDSPKDEISRDVFKLWIDHGRRPDSATYAYIVLPAVPEEEVAQFSAGNAINIIANNGRVQAVEDRQAERAQMVFYTAGSIGISGNLVVTSESPGMLMLRREGSTIREITVSDPSRKLASLHFSVNAELRAVGPGFTARWDPERKRTDISIPLPQGVYAGKSVTVELQ